MTVCLIFSLICLHLTTIHGDKLYSHPRDQFPRDSEHLKLPNISFLSIYLGILNFSHLPLLFESMRSNSPQMQFTIINILDSSELYSTTALDKHIRDMSITNIKIHSISSEKFSEIVRNRLNISINFTKEWHYKLCDFKPTLAYLFPDFVQEQQFKYWGYGDLDLIWGNVSRFAYMFQEKQPIFETGNV